MVSHQEIVSLFGVSVLADGIGRSAKAVSAWKARSSIPGDAWLPVVRFAAVAGHPEVTLDLLARIAAGEPFIPPATPTGEPSDFSPDGDPAGAGDMAPAGDEQPFMEAAQ
ncbi:hypothetical protein [Pleomorphomonas koreensis]|uniref:hypothetical protein n=1 Tax=Pleomorphomonas koreensis TaxID=257440 RepID=UPI0004787DF6|nr:hypothetical protein [Pleomorphomonas koreensis]